MVGNLPLADQILGAGDLIGEDRRDQVFRLHAQDLRRNLLAAAKTGQGERHASHPTPTRREHWRVQHRLDEHAAHAVGMEVTRDVAKLEAVRGGQRQHDIVFGRRRLQLEIEFAAKALAQRQSPGAIEAAAEGAMNDELHAARFVEEPLEDDRVLRRQTAKSRGARGKIIDELIGRGRGDADFLGEPAPRGRSGRVGTEPRRDLGAQTRDGG